MLLAGEKFARISNLIWNKLFSGPETDFSISHAGPGIK